jgi:chromosome segregation ATPase
MSPPKPKTDSPGATTGSLPRDPEALTLLIQDIRRDLIHSQITVLELNDAIMRKETEKADAVSILAELELALEAKITYLVRLDADLNRQLAELRRQLAGETSEKQARDTIIQDLVQKLDAANRELGAAHTLAGGYARDLAQARETLARVSGELAEHQGTLATTRQQLAETTAARDALAAKVRAMEATLSWRLTKPFRALRRMFS